MEKNRTIIDFYLRRKEILANKLNGKIRWFNQYYEYCFVDTYEDIFPDLASSCINIKDVFAVVVEEKGEMIFVAIQFPDDKFNTDSIIEWVSNYEIIIPDKTKDAANEIKCEEIVKGVLFKGNPLILVKKGKNSVSYDPLDFVEVMDEFAASAEIVNMGHSKNINLEQHKKRIRIMLNNEALDAIPRIDFDLTRDLMIVNGNVLVADYIDKYGDTVGFYNSENDLLPVAFVLDDDTTVNINIEEREDGSRLCVVEFGYIIYRDLL